MNDVFRETLYGRRPELWADKKRKYGIPQVDDEIVFKFFKFKLQPPLFRDRHVLIISYELEYARVMAEHILALGPSHYVNPGVREFYGKRSYYRRGQYDIADVA